MHEPPSTRCQWTVTRDWVETACGRPIATEPADERAFGPTIDEPTTSEIVYAEMFTANRLRIPLCGTHREKAARLGTEGRQSYHLLFPPEEPWSSWDDREVYVLRRASDGAIKIGVSVNPEKRMRTIEGRHGACELLFTTNGGGVRAERALHDRFMEYQLPGREREWFAPGERLLDWIAAVRARRSLPEVLA